MKIEGFAAAIGAMAIVAETLLFRPAMFLGFAFAVVGLAIMTAAHRAVGRRSGSKEEGPIDS